MDRPKLLLAPAAALAVAVAAQCAEAREAGAVPAAAPVVTPQSLDFDLARDCQPDAPAKAAAPADPEPDWRTEIHGLSARENLRPRWSHEIVAAGPTIELGTFAKGKRKDRPGLAHLALDWEF